MIILYYPNNPDGSFILIHIVDRFSNSIGDSPSRFFYEAFVYDNGMSGIGRIVGRKIPAGDNRNFERGQEIVVYLVLFYLYRFPQNSYSGYAAAAVPGGDTENV